MSTLIEKIQSGACILDVRTTEEYDDDHYPGAINVPLDQLMLRMDEVGPHERSVVVYCLSGARSSYATRMLKASGYVDVVNAGGLEDMPGRE